MIREDQVGALISAIGTLDGTDFELMLELSTAEEIAEATRLLAAAATTLGKPPDPLSANLWQTVRWAAQGRAFEHIAGLLPCWSSWPDQSLSDQLKTAPPHVVAQVRDTLRRAGFTVDEPSGEADDHGLADGPG